MGVSLSLGNNCFTQQRDMELLGELTGVLPVWRRQSQAAKEASTRGFKELRAGLQQDSLGAEAI